VLLMFQLSKTELVLLLNHVLLENTILETMSVMIALLIARLVMHGLDNATSAKHHLLLQQRRTHAPAYLISI